VVCGVETNGRSLRCFAAFSGTELTYPSRWPTAVAALSQTSAVEIGGQYDGRIVRFGYGETTVSDAYPVGALPGPYSGVAAALSAGVCGIRSDDGGVDCGREIVTPAYGVFTQMEIEHYRVNVQNPPLEACGLTVEGWARCFGDSSRLDELWTPW